MKQKNQLSAKVISSEYDPYPIPTHYLSKKFCNENESIM